MMRTMRSGTPPSAGPIAGEARFGGFASLARGWVVAFLRLCVLGPRLRLVPAAGEARLGGFASLARGWGVALLRLWVLGPRLRLVPRVGRLFRFYGTELFFTALYCTNVALNAGK